MRSGRPRGPGKAFKKVGGFAPHHLVGDAGPPGPAPSKTHPKNSGQTAFRYPVLNAHLVVVTAAVLRGYGRWLGGLRVSLSTCLGHPRPPDGGPDPENKVFVGV